MSADRRTLVLDGPLAHRMARLAAARRCETGLQLYSLPSLAARLAGGFTRPAAAPDLDAAIRLALEDGDFEDLERIRKLPGMTRAAARTLSKVWNSDLDLGSLNAGASGRLRDLELLERRVRDRLPPAVMTARDLRDAAIGRVQQAPAVLGPVVLDRLGEVAPVWRPLVVALAAIVDVEWHNPGCDDVAWFPGRIIKDEIGTNDAYDTVSCANQQAEVVEALRWARELIASGRARPEQVAICATAPAEWDEHFVALAGDASVPLHFSHGVPALASWEGQYCAALADVLLHGLSQARIRRLLGYARGRGPALRELGEDWAVGLHGDASLTEVGHWRTAFFEAQAVRESGGEPGKLLLPVLETLSMGPRAAQEAGDLVLPTGVRRLWIEALQRAPATALDLSLEDLRFADAHEAGVCAVWAPASHLAASPRPWVRLLGLTARSWPRRASDDPLLPEHVLPRKTFAADTTQQDRRAFSTIVANATGGCVLSHSRRSAQGGLIAPSPLLGDTAVRALRRTRIPAHAYSEADRLLARPAEAVRTPRVAGAMACWRDWRKPVVTPHDGNASPDHPLVVRAISEVQSATSLRCLLRDPLAFIWRYALDWRAIKEEDQPLSLDPRAFGELVHALLKATVESLEPAPGFMRAKPHEVDEALTGAKAAVARQWPMERPVPPPLLWHHTIELAGRLATKALTLDAAKEATTRSWAEVPFGQIGDDGRVPTTSAPWNSADRVTIPGTDISIKGVIDRLDLRQERAAVRVTDYKTGRRPQGAIVLGGGTELQRVIYAIATQHLLPGPLKVQARLLFLGESELHEEKLPDVTSAIGNVSAFIAQGVDLLKSGTFLPAGPDVKVDFNDYRLLLPASDFYYRTKGDAFSQAYGSFSDWWDTP